MQSLLQTLRHEFEIKINRLQQIVHRDLVVPDIPGKIKVIVGMRRTGKTYYLLEKIQDLLKKGVPYSQILYLSLEDDRIQQINAKQLAALVDEFYTLHPENHQQPCYLFFDEIHAVEGWSQVIRRLQDTKEVNLYLTGSSAKLLSKEIATELRGRSIAYEMWPFSFTEYLRALNIEFKEPKSRIDFDYCKKYLHTYLSEGGFPETTLLAFPEKNTILQEYVNVVIYRDVVDRYHISNLSLIKYIIKTLLKNPATSMATNKLYNDIKSQGYAVGRTTVYEYLEYITDAYLTFMVPLYSESVRKTQINPKKIYAVDPGLSRAYTFSTSSNVGHLFENMIYLDLRRAGQEIYYYFTKEKYEIDFFTRSPEGKLHLYQVAWDIEDPKTLERETRALRSAEQELGIPGTLLTPETYFSWARKQNEII